MATQVDLAPGFGARLRQVRQRRLQTLREFGKDIGVSYSLIHSWESGKGSPSLRNLRKLGQKLDVSLDWLAWGRE